MVHVTLNNSKFLNVLEFKIFDILTKNLKTESVKIVLSF